MSPRIKRAALDALMTATVFALTGLGIIVGTVTLALCCFTAMRVLDAMMPVFKWILI